MAQALPITRLVNVSVNLSPLAAQTQNLSTLLILGPSNVIDTVERLRSYATLSAVANDFGTTTPEYLAAQLWFQQAPQPTTLQIGRWAQGATAGQLKGGLLSASQQALTNFTSVTTGAFKVTVDGAAAVDVTGINLSTALNLNGVASLIQTKLQIAVPSATCVWNSSFSRFEFTSPTTGAASSFAFLAAPSAGTDISVLLNGRSTGGGYVVQGQVAETALACATLFDTNYGQGFYGVTLLGGVDADQVAISAFIEGSTNKHIFGVSSQDSTILSPSGTTDIAYVLSQTKPKRTVIQYSSSTPYSVCSLLGRILTTQYNGNNTVITLMYKQEPGIAPETINSTQIAALEAKYCNVFVAYNNSTAIIEKGTVSSGDFLDTITGTDWLALTIQNNVFNLLYTSNTKIPQTDAGNQLIVTTVESVCSQGVRNGLLAPGVWGSGGFGALSQGDFLPKGFYVYAPPIATQFAADREARKSVPIQVAAKLAGAIHTVDITVNVNR